MSEQNTPDLGDATSVGEVRIHPLLIPITTHNTQASDVSDVDMRMMALREAVAQVRFGESGSQDTLEVAQAYYRWMKTGEVS